MKAEQLIDRIMICELKARYCRLLDTKQWDAWGLLFSEAAVLDASDGGGPPPVHGRDMVVNMVRTALGDTRTAHHVHSPEIEITGDDACGTWAMQDRLVFENGSAMTGYGHYKETYVRRDGTWSIATSTLTRLHIDFAATPVA